MCTLTLNQRLARRGPNANCQRLSRARERAGRALWTTRRLVAVGAVSATMVLAGAGQAQAKYPGTNGQVAFTRYDPLTGASHVFVANPAGAGERQLPVDAADVAVWSPDGSQILLTICCTTGPPRPAIINADGSDFRLLSVPDLPPDGAVGCRAWSPDGTQLLCQFMGNIDPSLDGIYTIRTSDGAVLKRMTVNPFPPIGNFGGGDIPGDYSPDGKQFVFMRAMPGSGPVPDRNQSGALFVEKSDGTGLHQITPYGLANSHDNGLARWSPDGSEILFGAAHARFNGAMLFVVHADGTGLRKIPLKVGGTLSFAFTPGWSPDGTRIIFSLFLRTPGEGGIFTANADGTGVSPVSTAGPEDFADWGTHPLTP